jgi:hypothetical protein
MTDLKVGDVLISIDDHTIPEGEYCFVHFVDYETGICLIRFEDGEEYPITMGFAIRELDKYFIKRVNHST